MSNQRIEYYSGYESWEDHIYKTVTVDPDRKNHLLDKHQSLITNPPLTDFIAYQKKQY